MNNDIKLSMTKTERYEKALELINSYIEIDNSSNNTSSGFKVLANEENINRCMHKVLQMISVGDIKELLEKGLNTGNRNTGDDNTGYLNTGNRNKGYRNTGNRNTGDYNTGDCNTGDYNTGESNTGSCNPGAYNTGHYNIGIFNTCNGSNGMFCTKEPKIAIFNIQSDITATEFYESKWWKAITSSEFPLTEWVEYTEEEKKNDVNKRNAKGYTTCRTYKEACKIWWDNLTCENKEIIKTLPNFNTQIFKEITGISLDI